MLEAKAIRKAFGKTQALSGVSFEARPGEVLGVVGENGSGKSTLLRILSGELAADAGEILLNGRTVRKGDVFLVHQELALCPHLTVAENIFLGRFGGAVFARRAIEARASEILKGLGYPQIEPSQRVGSLPIALRQIVEIARSMAHESPVVLFDEPTSSLTKADVANLFTLIHRLRDQGKIVLFISHFLEEVRSVADRVVILRDGERVAVGPMSEFNDEAILTHMVGRRVEELFPRSHRVTGEELLRLDALEGLHAKPRGASLTLHRGEVIGLAGLAGAGRTELIRAVMALDTIRAGRVLVKGIQPSTIQARWMGGMGMVSEDRKTEGLALNLSIAENLMMARRRSLLSRPRQGSAEAATWAERLGVKCRTVEQPIGTLSGGNQQKVAIARLLAAKCDVLLLDEPTRGIDVGSKAEIYRLIDELALQGCGILIASSYLPELLGICDRIGVMNRGVLSELLPAAAATPEGLMELCIR